MNALEPCVNCEYLYYDCVYAGSIDDDIACKLNLQIGNIECPKFKQYRNKKQYSRKISVDFTHFIEE